MVPLLFGLLLLALLIGAMRWLASAPPASLLKGLRLTGLVLLASGGLFLALTGRLGLALAALSGFLPWVRRLFQANGADARPDTGQRSEVVSLLLRMELDHDSGAMRGEVIAGPFKGRLLDRMTHVELSALWREAQSDADSLQLLEAWLERNLPGWRETFGQGQAHGGGGEPSSDWTGGRMTKEEACQILGVGPNASVGEIKSAHRRLIMKVHPDLGGSAYLAARINGARALLLND